MRNGEPGPRPCRPSGPLGLLAARCAGASKSTKGQQAGHWQRIGGGFVNPSQPCSRCSMSPSQFVCIDGAAVRLAWKRDRLCATVAWWELDENSRDSHWSCRARTDDVLVVDSNGAPTKFPPGSSLEPLLFDAVHHTASGTPLPTALLRLRRHAAHMRQPGRHDTLHATHRVGAYRIV